MTKQIEMVLTSPRRCIYRENDGLCKASKDNTLICSDLKTFPDQCPLTDVVTCGDCRHMDQIGPGEYVCPIILMGEAVLVWPDHKACGAWEGRPKNEDRI
jgi:hypothetical protein